MIDQDKRDTLRKVTQLSLISAFGALPLVGNAGAEMKFEGAANAPQNLDPNVDLVLSFHRATTDTSGNPLCRVSLSNKSAEDITLKHFGPGIVSTAHGNYDINRRLAKGDIRVGSGGEYHFWIEGVKPGSSQVSVPVDVSKRIKVKVISALETGGLHPMASTAIAHIG